MSSIFEIFPCFLRYVFLYYNMMLIRCLRNLLSDCLGVQNNEFMSKGTLEPSVLRCCILAPYVLLRATSSESVPCDEFDYFVQRRKCISEFCN